MVNVLIMDNDEFFLDIFMSLVSHLGFKPYRCGYPEALLDLLHDDKFPILLVNLHDNYFNEYDEITAILNRIDYNRTKTILMSSYYDTDFEKEPFFHNLHAYLIKPKGLLHLKKIFHDLSGFVNNQNKQNLIKSVKWSSKQANHVNSLY